jgi:hypothetical protein
MFIRPHEHIMPDMGKKKTSIYIDEDLWNEWMHFVLDDSSYGSSRKASEALEDAMRCYLRERSSKRTAE